MEACCGLTPGLRRATIRSHWEFHDAHQRVVTFLDCNDIGIHASTGASCGPVKLCGATPMMV